MSIYTATYPAKCKHCRYHRYAYLGRRHIGICTLDRKHEDNKLHEDDKRRSGNQACCDNIEL